VFLNSSSFSRLEEIRDNEVCSLVSQFQALLRSRSRLKVSEMRYIEHIHVDFILDKEKGIRTVSSLVTSDVLEELMVLSAFLCFMFLLNEKELICRVNEIRQNHPLQLQLNIGLFHPIIILFLSNSCGFLTTFNTEASILRFNGHFTRCIWVCRYQNVSILDFIGI